MCLVRLASGYEWKDGLESSRGRRRPCRCHDFRQYAADVTGSGTVRVNTGLTDCGLAGPKNDSKARARDGSGQGVVFFFSLLVQHVFKDVRRTRTRCP
jgi:hypothetical protein